jgi:hypothetical protein
VRLSQIAITAAGATAWASAAGIAFCQGIAARESNPPVISLGRTSEGAEVGLMLGHDGWGLEMSGSTIPRAKQPHPAEVMLYRGSPTPRILAAAYRAVRRKADGVEAVAEVGEGGRPLFRFHDRWSMRDGVATVHRRVEVLASQPGGFATALSWSIDPAVRWEDMKVMAPGIIYGDPSHDGERSPGGTLAFQARSFQFREDILPAPLLALSFAQGGSLAMLDPAPTGDTTEADTTLAAPDLIDRRFRFGALAVEQTGAGTALRFSYPGNVSSFGERRQSSATPVPVRRYHPIVRGAVDHYAVSFRIGAEPTFPAMSRAAWRWAWTTLNPAVRPLDFALVRRVLLDHLEHNAATLGGRTAIPFAISTVPVPERQWNWTMAGMGFVSKNLECADQLLREGDRDNGTRGQAMRATGLAIIRSMIEALPTVPLPATGFDLATGKPYNHIWLAPWLRNASEDMRVLVGAYARERALGRDHPEWLAWTRQYADWLLAQQRPDGSWPRRWFPSSAVAAEPSGTASYAPVPLLVQLTQQTGDRRYLAAATRAADYIWSSFGSRGLFIGGASDNPDITDKEAGMLSMEAFLSLHEATGDSRWLARAQAAGDFAESWIWIWDLPMPVDADNAQLHWKRGVPTTGLQGITALSAGGADEYLDWAVPSFAKLYKLTGDPHYLAVARVLLNDTKAMVALPGRQYDMIGPGWQQENFGMGPGGHGRGVGGHRFWLPWVSANHLHGITAMDEYDPTLFQQMSGSAAGISAGR